MVNCEFLRVKVFRWSFLISPCKWGVWDPQTSRRHPLYLFPLSSLCSGAYALSRSAQLLSRYSKLFALFPSSSAQVLCTRVPRSFGEEDDLSSSRGGGLGCRFGKGNRRNTDFLGGPSLTFGRLQVSIVSMPRLMRFWTPKLILNWAKIDTKISLDHNSFFPCFRHRFWIDFWQIFE